MAERHEYELSLAEESIDPTRTKARSPQTKGICGRFHKTVLNASARKLYRGCRRRVHCQAKSKLLYIILQGCRKIL